MDGRSLRYPIKKQVERGFSSGQGLCRLGSDELLRRRKADAAIATSNECNSSFKLTHVFLLLCHRVGRFSTISREEWELQMRHP